MSRWRFRLAGLLLVALSAGPAAAGSISKYLVIVNQTETELMVSYRTGAFTGPDFEPFVMLKNPTHSPGDQYTKVGKYWPLSEDQVRLKQGILTFSISPDTGAIVGGIWKDSSIDAEAVAVGAPRLEIAGAGETIVYEGLDVFSAFDRRASRVRMLVVE